MAVTAKSQISDWVESLTKQIEQAYQPPQANRSNTQRSKRNRILSGASAQEALQLLQSLNEALTAQSAAVDQRELEFDACNQQLSDALATRAAAIEAREIEFEERSQRLGDALTTRAAEFDAREGEFEERSRRLSDATTQLEEQLKTATSRGQASPANLPGEQLSQQVAGQIVDRVAERVASQLELLLETKLGSWGVAADSASNSRNGIESAASLHDLQTQLADAQARMTVRDKEHACEIKETATMLSEVRKELAAANAASTALQAELLASKDLLVSFDRQFANDMSQVSERALIAELEAEVASLQSILAAVRSESRDVAGAPQDLKKILAEVSDLRQQNSDLATQLARLQMSSSQHASHLSLASLSQESMTWEQRKRLILQQLENDAVGQNPAEHSQHRTEIEEILRATQSEIEHRDEEIAELKSIVEQQSNTREGLAIGAAAIAEMLDSDELVMLERSKLVAIQQEWESKLREAEIQMSMERAKLSRERAELEEQRKMCVSAESNPVADTKVSADGKPVRKWLEHMGLRDK